MAAEPALPHEILDDEPASVPAPCATRLTRAVTDGHLCSEACPHLLRGHDGDPVCEAFWGEDLHVSFEAEPITTTPRAERCTECFIAEELFS